MIVSQIIPAVSNLLYCIFLGERGALLTIEIITQTHDNSVVVAIHWGFVVENTSPDSTQSRILKFCNYLSAVQKM